MERVYKAKNGVIEKTRFWVGDNTQPRRGRKRSTTPRKAEDNRNQAAHQLGRLLNNNFSQGDLFLSPGYSDAAYAKLLARVEKKLPADASEEQLRRELRREARHDAELFLRRLKRECEKIGVTVRSVLVTSDMDGDTGETVRVHHHIVLSGDGVTVTEKKTTINGRTLSQLWGHGSAEYEFMRSGSYNALAAYLLRQTRSYGANEKKYAASRNLEKILPSERIVQLGAMREIAVPAEARVEERQYNAAEPMCQYVRYIVPEGKQRKSRENGGGDGL